MTTKDIINNHLWEFAQAVDTANESFMVQIASLIWAKTGSKANFSKFYRKMKALCTNSEFAYDLPEHPEKHNGFKDREDKINKIESYLGLISKK